MGEHCFPNTKLKLVEEVRSEELIEVELEPAQVTGKFRKSILYRNQKNLFSAATNTYTSRDCRCWTQHPVYLNTQDIDSLFK